MSSIRGFLKKKPDKELRNREFIIVTYVVFTLLLMMCVYLCYFMYARSESFINSSYNKRIGLMQEAVIKGDIITRDGKLVATTVTDTNGSQYREYPENNIYAHAIGYNDNGAMGVEKDANFPMFRSHNFIVKRVINEINGIKNHGDTIVTSLYSNLQEIAYMGMGNYKGAVIALDPTTGEVLCEVSKSDFNPNEIVSKWESISKDSENSVLLNRATQGAYPPGSIFKILTLLEYLNEGGSLDETFECNGEFTNDGNTIHCYHKKVHGKQSLRTAFANSCNCVFAQISLGLDKEAFRNLSESLLFNEDLPGNLYPNNQSSFSIDGYSSEVEMMQTGIGQGKTLVSPLHMLMLVSALANDGVLIKPHLVTDVLNHDGDHVRSIKPETYGTIFTESNVSVLRDAMSAVTNEGTARIMSGAPYSAYGKTGSAEFKDNSSDSHSWYIGFAESGGKKIAIAVIMEGAGAGSEYATPLAKKIFDAYFNS